MIKSPPKAGHEVAVDATTSLGQVLQESYVLYLEERATFANQGYVE